MTPFAAKYPAVVAAREAITRDEERERLCEFIVGKQAQKRRHQWDTEMESDSEVRVAKKRLLELAKTTSEVYEDEEAREEEMVRERREGQQHDSGSGRLEMEEPLKSEMSVEEAQAEKLAMPVQEPRPESPQAWREEGQEPFRVNGFEPWTELYPTWLFPCQHPWDMVGWTANFLADADAHSSICPACEGYLEELAVRTWDSGNWCSSDELWIYQLLHEKNVPKVEGWLEGHPVVAEEAEGFEEWEETSVGDVEVVETSLDEMHQYQADAQLRREKDEFDQEMYNPGDSEQESDEEDIAVSRPHKLTAEERKANFKPNENDEPADFQLRYENFVYHLDAMEHLKKFGSWPTEYHIPED
ncbi:hypothetical protein EV426DRAFT_702395 [Tirmania nivea]|nr:hypothetical protein EV426DRAFT_702395 [Tirmania nivea]